MRTMQNTTLSRLAERFDNADGAITQWMARHGLFILRVSLGIWSLNQRLPMKGITNGWRTGMGSIARHRPGAGPRFEARVMAWVCSSS